MDSDVVCILDLEEVDVSSDPEFISFLKRDYGKIITYKNSSQGKCDTNSIEIFQPEVEAIAHHDSNLCEESDHTNSIIPENDIVHAIIVGNPKVSRQDQSEEPNNPDLVKYSVSDNRESYCASDMANESTGQALSKSVSTETLCICQSSANLGVCTKIFESAGAATIPQAPFQHYLALLHRQIELLQNLSETVSLTAASVNKSSCGCAVISEGRSQLGLNEILTSPGNKNNLSTKVLMKNIGTNTSVISYSAKETGTSVETLEIGTNTEPTPNTLNASNESEKLSESKLNVSGAVDKELLDRVDKWCGGVLEDSIRDSSAIELTHKESSIIDSIDHLDPYLRPKIMQDINRNTKLADNSRIKTPSDKGLDQIVKVSRGVDDCFIIDSPCVNIADEEPIFKNVVEERIFANSVDQSILSEFQANIFPEKNNDRLKKITMEKKAGKENTTESSCNFSDCAGTSTSVLVESLEGLREENLEFSVATLEYMQKYKLF